MLNHKFLQPDLYQAVCEAAATAAATGNELEDAAPAMMRVLLHRHVAMAARLRHEALGLSCASNMTDTYRLIHGEGDGLSGLAVDVIGRHTLVVMSGAAWCERYKHLIESVLLNIIDGCEIIWKTAPSRLAQDGIVSSTVTTTKHRLSTATAAEAETLLDDDDEPDVDVDQEDGIINKSMASKMIVSLENGIAYETYPSATGQKTGVYSDQRENRLAVANYCQNKRVLDLCCFTGGFSLNAAINGGAKHCTGVDSSLIAIETCRANAVRNNVSNDEVKFVPSDITSFLQSCKEKYDVVVLDPPKLAPSVKLLDKARRKYHALNRDAVSVVDEQMGGLLLTCTCSAAMTQAEGGQYFLKMVQAAAQAAGRQVTLLTVSGAAPCHTQSPISYPASAYLTAALFCVHPKE
jgi:23S rRNA G2069 N7-methylase RlmK/C1962 C5-methylase RlmI